MTADDYLSSNIPSDSQMHAKNTQALDQSSNIAQTEDPQGSWNNISTN